MKRRKGTILIIITGVLAGLWLICLPRDLFKNVPYSTVVESAEGELLGARIADDQQWRFPPSDTVPDRYKRALIQFEDRHFRYHPGVDPLAIVRSVRDNIRAGHVVSGGSTITMQVIRLSRGKERRTLYQKIIEAVLATRLELRLSKDEILALYAAHAPFGGNVVGLEAASWRYFGASAENLTWAEAATLAVLPNSPSSMHPGKNRDDLLLKRNRLLERLLEHGDIDMDTYGSAVEEPLPGAPLPLPSLASHYVERCPKGKRTRTGIVYPFQKAIEESASRRSREMALEGIADLAVVVMDNENGEIVAYVGNADGERKRPGMDVDIAASPRSTGSILKPFLYAAALEAGTILPRTLLPDVPVNLGGFAPENFDRQFYGAVHADEALARSLNVPSVFLLRNYGIEKFHSLLGECGMSTFTRGASHYGLSLILGGGEARLDEVTKAYSDFVRGTSPIKDPVARWYTLHALEEVNRPDQLDWRLIRSVRKAAWKTGTSYGFRDAWAVGMTPRYTIGVWAGNADGHGVPGLTGARAAGPVLFDILNLLPEAKLWFPEYPEGEGVYVEVCPDSGFPAGPECPDAESLFLPKAAREADTCPYHDGGEFTLTPAMEWYYKPHHPEYRGASSRQGAVMEFIYPAPGTTVFLPRQLGGSVEGAVFRLAHRRPGATVWWHLDQSYVGETRFIHEIRLAPSPGKHTVTAVDGDGASVSVSFTVGE